MRKAEVKARILEGLQNNEYAGFKYGDVKKVIFETNGDEGFVGIFYKNCKKFETYKGIDTRPVEIFSYSFEIEEEEEEDGIITETVHFHYDLHFDCNGSDEEWKEKKHERMTDKDFFEYWI